MESVQETLEILTDLLQIVSERLEELRLEKAPAERIEREERRLKQLQDSFQALQEQLANS
ncbi:MAG: hypothetical protein KIS92_08765 [Planctomycetota bacterium]|nr:hypothetical protein [Planctomycetota bacterium]